MIRSGGTFLNNGEGYVIVHFRSKHDTNGNSYDAWVAFDIDGSGRPIAVCDTEREMEGDELQLTVWTTRRKLFALRDRLEMP